MKYYTIAAIIVAATLSSGVAQANHTYYDMSDPNSVTVYQNNTYGDTTQVVTTGNNLDNPSIINLITRSDDGGGE